MYPWIARRALVVVLAASSAIVLTGCGHTVTAETAPLVTATATATSFPAPVLGPPVAAVSSSGPCPSPSGAWGFHPGGGSAPSLLRVGEHPVRALVCSYGPFGRALVSQEHLDAHDATVLATSLAGVSTAPGPTGPTSCPMDQGTFAILSFGYGTTPDATIRWGNEGCQTLSNGHVRATYLANPSFWAFQTAFDTVMARQ
ncbi:MAG: hypothetical protein JWP75_2260 [Frondihabitans sp.]|nr:hypothetical protein [Frondihabitans sp.]